MDDNPYKAPVDSRHEIDKPQSADGWNALTFVPFLLAIGLIALSVFSVKLLLESIP